MEGARAAAPSCGNSFLHPSHFRKETELSGGKVGLVRSGGLWLHSLNKNLKAMEPGSVHPSECQFLNAGLQTWEKGGALGHAEH